MGHTHTHHTQHQRNVKRCEIGEHSNDVIARDETVFVARKENYEFSEIYCSALGIESLAT